MKLVGILTLLFVMIGLSTCAYPNFLYYSNLNAKYVNLSTSGLLTSPFRSTSQTVFLVHGWKTNVTDKESSYFTAIRDSLLTYTPSNNVILVDWAEAAQGDYDDTVKIIRKVSKGISDFITNNNLDLSLVYCVGHSLGAHACGFAGKTLNGKIARITGLDPAGPSFDNQIAQNRLNATDAQFVDVIHTTQLLGIELSVGYYDFFPNFDNSPFTNQPDCKGLKIKTLICNHRKACTYFATSLKPSCSYTLTKCKDFKKESSGTFNGCKSKGYGTATMQLGYYATKNGIPGEYARKDFFKKFC